MNVNQEDLHKEILKLKEENAYLRNSMQVNTAKLLFESSPDIIVQVDAQYKIIVVHLPDYPIEQLDALKGSHIFEITPASVRNKTAAALEKVFSTGDVVIYESEGEENGVYKYFANRVSAIKNEHGEIDSAYFVSREITAQKVASIQAIESEQKLTAIFEGSSQILSLFDKENKFVWYNREAYDKSIFLFGRFLEVGKIFEDFLPEQHREKSRANFKKVLNGEIVVYHREYVYENKPFFLEIMLQPVYQNNGELVGISLVGTNVTDRREYEARLEKANKELMQQNDQLNQYSYILSHNLRAPIVTLLGLVSILNQTENDPVETEAIIEHITKSAHHLDTVIKDLNQVLSVNDKKILMSSVNLEAEFDIVKFLLKNQIEVSGAIIISDFSETVIIQSIKSYIHNILYNLLSNALKYKKEDKAPHIRVVSYMHKGMVCIEFTDDGIGIDLEKFSDKLFGFYKRFHTHVEGKGIGLHLIKKQIDALEGRIEVESVVNEGTTFRVLLPQ
jgi:PAS domain S-box-containing protein